MATVLGFPTETHKLLLVTPIKATGKNKGKKVENFDPMVLELNFGSEQLFSSGTYMHCLKCAKFTEDSMMKCSPPFVCSIEKDFIIHTMNSYIDTIQFFGPRKCNCQSVRVRVKVRVRVNVIVKVRVRVRVRVSHQ
jgi:hypothetical protein